MKMKFNVKKPTPSQMQWQRYVNIAASRTVDLEKLFQCEIKKGLKFSKKRAAVVEYFINTDRHYTVEQLYDEIKTMHSHIGYSTVYRTLRFLVECGLARAHKFGQADTKFELVHKEEHHDHLVCLRCGRIIEFTHRGIEKFQVDVARKHNFTVRKHELQIFGICSVCRDREKKQRST